MNTPAGFALVLLAWALCATAETPQTTVALPQPDTVGGAPLMQALKHRQSVREFSGRPFSDTLLGNLLWAANGVNRPEENKRTAPTAHNNQDIDVYVVTEEGVYRYLPGSHSLAVIDTKDMREETGKQGFVDEAPVNLVYVADYSRGKRVSDQQKPLYAAAQCGFISQNVYLFCASFGLATVVRTWFDEAKLSAALKLGETQKPLLAQTVGYPRE